MVEYEQHSQSVHRRLGLVSVRATVIATRLQLALLAATAARTAPYTVDGI